MWGQSGVYIHQGDSREHLYMYWSKGTYIINILKHRYLYLYMYILKQRYLILSCTEVKVFPSEHVPKQMHLYLYMYWNKGTFIVYVLKQRYLQVLAKLDVLNQKFGLLNIRKRQKNEKKYDKYLNTA